MVSSSKQKLNATSSTESEVIGCCDYVRKGALFSRCFLYEQGYDLETVVYQDNSSALKLEKNGHRSCSQRTRHIDIRYFYIKDLIDKGIIRLEHCPTELVIADFFTNPLHGAVFQRMKQIVMGGVIIAEFLLTHEK